MFFAINFLVVTSIQQASCIKRSVFWFPLMKNRYNFTCIKQAPVLSKGFSVISLRYLLNTGWNAVEKGINERHHEKSCFFAYAKTKAQISCAVTAQLISAFVFATYIVQSLYFLNQKFQASNHLLGLYSHVCVGPGQKPRRLVFS